MASTDESLAEEFFDLQKTFATAFFGVSHFQCCHSRFITGQRFSQALHECVFYLEYP